MGDRAVLEWKWPVLGQHERAAEWLRVWSDLGRAPRTIEAYARGLAEYLQVCEREGVDPIGVNRAHLAGYVRELTSRPSHRGANVVSIDSGAGLANATIQQRLMPVRLFYDYLMEEGLQESNPGGRWRSPLAGRRFDTTVDLRPEEAVAIAELGVDNLRRLRRHDPLRAGVAGDQAAAVAAGGGQRRPRIGGAPCSTWSPCCWCTRPSWAGPSGAGRRRSGSICWAATKPRSAAPCAWAGDEVRPYLAAHVCVVGSVTAFHRIGGFQRMALSQRIFGRDRVNGEIAGTAGRVGLPPRPGRGRAAAAGGLPAVLAQPQPAPGRPLH
ncbi:site-specific integrase [Haloactinomyces albus]|uniref:Core-binding (CB) domain-containing protein n=1 Tax=Haloactinomyces albus TaxID=1352928 RepID=A0AAE4CP58_9ACTN|nr:site-specific integrase [Haloactinomyces albus]MDR7304539.1 hypothetical protein [Haloactinomyces albus]